MPDLIPDLTRFDLRFKDRETEASFKASVEPEVLRFGVLGSMILEVLIVMTFVPVVIQEQTNESNPYDASFSDIRTIIFVLWLFCFCSTGLFCVLGLIRIWWGWFKQWNWEALFMVMSTYYVLNLALANFWHFPLIFGHYPTDVWAHDARGAEVYILLALDGIMTVIAMYIPIRSCALWVLPLCGVGSYLTMLVVVDSVFPDDRFKSVSALIALTIVACHGAYRNEKHRREKWIAQLQVIEATEVVKLQETQIAETTALVKGLRTVANALCDVIVKLTEDLRVCGTEAMLDAFFEQKMEDKPFLEVLAGNDRQRFNALLNNVSASQEVHGCMPVTIRKASSMCEAHLLLVDTGRSMPRYFLGIRVEMEHLDPPPEDGNTVDYNPGVATINAIRPTNNGQPNLLGVLPQPPGATDTGKDDQESDFSFTTHLKPSVGQQLAYTSVRARAISLKKVMPRWNIPRDTGSCCQFHTVVESIHEVADFLLEKECEPLWSNLSGGQCARCKSMCTHARTKCVVCGYIHR